MRYLAKLRKNILNILFSHSFYTSLFGRRPGLHPAIQAPGDYFQRQADPPPARGDVLHGTSFANGPANALRGPLRRSDPEMAFAFHHRRAHRSGTDIDDPNRKLLTASLLAQTLQVIDLIGFRRGIRRGRAAAAQSHHRGNRRETSPAATLELTVTPIHRAGKSVHIHPVGRLLDPVVQSVVQVARPGAKNNQFRTSQRAGQRREPVAGIGLRNIESGRFIALRSGTRQFLQQSLPPAGNPHAVTLRGELRRHFAADPGSSSDHDRRFRNIVCSRHRMRSIINYGQKYIRSARNFLKKFKIFFSMTIFGECG